MKLDYTVLDPTAGGGDTAVDTESPEFQKRLDFLMKFSGADSYRLSFGASIAPNTNNGQIVSGFSVLQTGDILFKEGTLETGVDVYLAFKSPDVALKNLCDGLGLPFPTPAPHFEHGATTGFDPVGPAWPAHGSNVFRVTGEYTKNPDFWPESCTFDKIVDGRKTRFGRIRVVRSTPGIGGAGGSYEPAWQLVDWAPNPGKGSL